MATAQPAIAGEFHGKKHETTTTVAGQVEPVGKSKKSADQQPLYADRIKVYPRRIQGTFRKLKWTILTVLLGLYYIGPWIRWDRGPGAPDQALLIDMEGPRAYFFSVEIWPQEVYYLTGLLILGAVGLFLATALLGRIWCGFTCPQTVWTDLFVWVERIIEGDRNARIRLDKSPLSVGKFGKKLVKHTVWLLISFLTGGAWILYFQNAPSFIGEFFVGDASIAAYGFTALFTGTTYLLAGWAREQVCIYMCPWPRFQSAMFDEDSLIVTYEEWRGEPRGGAKKGQSFEGRGHCVNCGLCWQVCPTGVDIRAGQQMACIGCALCVDACNSVMERFDLPRNLVTYDSISNQLAREKGQPARYRIFRPRIMVYVVVLTIVASVMAFSLVTRSRLEINVLHDRSPLFVQLSDGSIRNGYTFKILNMERENKTYTLTTKGIPDTYLTVIGYQSDPVQTVELTVKPDDVGSFRVFATTSRENVTTRTRDIDFVLTDTANGEAIAHTSVFSAPAN